MPMKNKFLLAAVMSFALPVLPVLAAGEPVHGQKSGKQGNHQGTKADKPAKPVMLPQPATTEPMPHIDPSRFGDKPADEAFGAFQRGLYLTAFNLAKPQAEKGDPASQTLIAEIYARGLGIPANQKLAAEWYEKAANNGVVEAQFRYAALLLQGTYTRKDPVKAEELMKKAAEGGNAMAQFNYGQMLMVKTPGKPGLDLAFPWFEKAAEAKLADAQYAVSQVYANGTPTIPRDDKKARVYLLLAAAQGYDTAQFDLGRWLIEGAAATAITNRVSAGCSLARSAAWLWRRHGSRVSTAMASAPKAIW